MNLTAFQLANQLAYKQLNTLWSLIQKDKLKKTKKKENAK